MSENVTNLRQAESTVVVKGILSEKNLKMENKDGRKNIGGSLRIQTSPDNFVSVTAWAAEKTKDGKENSIYKGLQTVMEEYKSVAEVGEEEATRVSITRGQLNPYQNQNKKTICGIRSNFFNRSRDDSMEASVSFEIYLTSITPEVYTYGENRGEETGRALVKGWFPTYNGIEPIEAVAPVEDGIAEAFLDAGYQAGDTIELFGDIVNKKIEIKREIPVKIGKPKVETTTNYINEIVLTGASEPYDESRAFPKEAIEKAIAEREINERNKENNTTVRRATEGASRGRSLPNF